MIEVFKTNIDNGERAQCLIEKIHVGFPCYQANFDTEDCDRILRIKSISEEINVLAIIELLRQAGCTAEVLPDELHDTCSQLQSGVTLG